MRIPLSRSPIDFEVKAAVLATIDSYVIPGPISNARGPGRLLSDARDR